MCDVFTLLLSYVTGQFAFGHAETVGPLMAALGLFNDSEPLRADNFAKHADRKFKTSEILPFSANVMFVLYECVPDDQHQTRYFSTNNFFLKLYVNEVARQIPGCEELHCPYRTVRDWYQAQVDECDFKKVCENNVKDEL